MTTYKIIKNIIYQAILSNLIYLLGLISSLGMLGIGGLSIGYSSISFDNINIILALLGLG